MAWATEEGELQWAKAQGTMQLLRSPQVPKRSKIINGKLLVNWQFLVNHSELLVNGWRMIGPLLNNVVSA